ncbi:hypothetical protein Y958_08360 [Nitrospirillum viridazoti CBAmc]|uniref:Uncharacterized protein n=1 Tax=Nitrospirillum viridazoti CBAmc TaxID=1441467 RepID=A0A248JQN3_9PROT|nr:hypothetical protein Y958_08360 [Nitrospirillum amazonense CBAmc]
MRLLPLYATVALVAVTLLVVPLSVRKELLFAMTLLPVPLIVAVVCAPPDAAARVTEFALPVTTFPKVPGSIRMLKLDPYKVWALLMTSAASTRVTLVGSLAVMVRVISSFLLR